MMRIIVISDTHGQLAAMEGILAAQPGADRFIHLGDGMGDVEQFRRLHPDRDLYSVRGNTDMLSGDPETAEMIVMGHRILYTHGHAFHVKLSIEPLRAYAVNNGYDIVLYGHTHQPCRQFSHGVHYLNPGSAFYGGRYRFGIVDITPSGVVCVTADISAKQRF